MKVKVKYTAVTYAMVEVDDKYKDMLSEDWLTAAKLEDEFVHAVRNEVDNVEPCEYIVNEVRTAEPVNGYEPGMMLYEYY